MEPTSASSSLSPPLDLLADDLEAYIRDALDILDSGEYVELTRLEEKVSFLCRGIAEMPTAQAKDYRPKLNGLIKQLDLLQTIMVEHKQKVEAQLYTLDAKKRASLAYAKSDAMSPASQSFESE